MPTTTTTTTTTGIMGTYRFQSKSRAQYEYTLSNASEVTNREVAEELKKIETEETRRELTELSNRIGKKFFELIVPDIVSPFDRRHSFLFSHIVYFLCNRRSI